MLSSSRAARVVVRPSRVAAVSLAVVLLLAGSVWARPASAAALRWRASEFTRLPSQPAPITTPGQQDAALSGIACPAVRSCTAAGSYEDGQNEGRAMVVGEKNGVWGPATSVTLPPDALPTHHVAHLDALSCVRVGDCEAVGTYTGAAVSEAMAASETNGAWQPAVRLDPPSGWTLARAYGISCISPGNCTAVGTYSIGTGPSQQSEAMVSSEANRVWTPSSEVQLPGDAAGAGQSAALSAVQCFADSGDCEAVGEYRDAEGNIAPMSVIQVAGTWGQASRFTALPAGANAVAGQQRAGFDGYSCVQSGACMAVGSYADGSGLSQMMVVPEANQLWGQARKVALPAGGADGQLLGVSCVDVRHCIAAGDYEDHSNSFHALVVRQSGAGWGSPTGVSLPGNATSSGQNSALDAVACDQGQACEAVGQYDDMSSSPQAMIVAPPPDTTLRLVVVKSRRHHARFTIVGTGDYTGLQCALVRARTGKRRGSSRPAYRSCPGIKAYSHLQPGRYVFYARAVGLGGVDPTPATHRFRIG